MGVIVKERETKSLGSSSCFLSLLRLLLGGSIAYGGKTGPFKLDSGLQDFETGIKHTGPSATRARHHLLVLLVLLHSEASLGRYGRGHPSHTILEWPGLAALHQELSYFLFLAHGHQQPWARKQPSLSVRKLLARSGSTMPTVTG